MDLYAGTVKKTLYDCDDRVAEQLDMAKQYIQRLQIRLDDEETQRWELHELQTLILNRVHTIRERFETSLRQHETSNDAKLAVLASTLKAQKCTLLVEVEREVQRCRLAVDIFSNAMEQKCDGTKNAMGQKSIEVSILSSKVHIDIAAAVDRTNQNVKDSIVKMHGVTKARVKEGIATILRAKSQLEFSLQVQQREFLEDALTGAVDCLSEALEKRASNIGNVSMHNNAQTQGCVAANIVELDERVGQVVADLTQDVALRVQRNVEELNARLRVLHERVETEISPQAERAAAQVARTGHAIHAHKVRARARVS